MTVQDGVSIIIPCYNENSNIIWNVQKIEKELKNCNVSDYEIIVVDDGSTSKETKLWLQKLKDIYLDLAVFKLVGYEENKGKGYAVKTGISYAKYSKIIFMDADLSTDLCALKPTIDILNSNDMVIASRHAKGSVLEKSQGGLRILIGFCCRKLTQLLTGIKFTDTQCGFKGFTYDCAMTLIHEQKIDRFAFDIEYIYIAQKHNFKIRELPVKWVNDPNSSVRVIVDSVRFFRDLLKIKKLHRG